MQYLLTPHASNYTSHSYWDNAFTDEQLNYLQHICKEKTQKAQVGSGTGGTVDPGIRRSDISWLGNTPEHTWIFETLGHVVSSLNAQFYRYDLTGFGEQIQLTNYYGDDKGTYGWHVDHGGQGSCRKLSLILQLSDPSEYEGGHLEVMPNSSNVERINKRRGLITVFPSWLLHQVTPVTSGLRQTAVLWVTGPAFR
jgi:PKHD-type hydroxylase